MRHHAFRPHALYRYGCAGLGAWRGDPAAPRGDVSEADGRAALNAAPDAGMTFIDTADVDGDGPLVAEKSSPIAAEARGGGASVWSRPRRPPSSETRMSPTAYPNKANLEGFITRKPENLGVDSLDSPVQLHCLADRRCLTAFRKCFSLASTNCRRPRKDHDGVSVSAIRN